jgi:hypothetical protein
MIPILSSWAGLYPEGLGRILSGSVLIPFLRAWACPYPEGFASSLSQGPD